MKLTTFKRLLVYIIAFFIVMNLFFWTGFIWKKIDELAYGKLYFDSAKASHVLSSIAVVDVNLKQNNPTEDKNCIECQRKILVKLLKTINAGNKKPEVLILDFSFSNESEQIDTLIEELEILKEDDVRVYAAYDIDGYESAPEDIKDFFYFDLQQSQELYNFLGQRLHTNFTIKKTNNKFLIEHESVKYQKNLTINNTIDTVAIESLVMRVYRDSYDENAKVPHKIVTVPLGKPDAMWANTFRFKIGAEDTLGHFEAVKDSNKEIDFNNKEFIIIGDLTHDMVSTKQTANVFPGPHLLAWTLNEELADKGDKIVKQFEGSLFINIIQTITFGLFTVLIFGLLFKYVKRLQTKPWALSVLSIIITLGFLALYILLFLSQDKIPRLGLTIIAILTAALLTLRFAYKFLVTGIAEGSNYYDVFISYSHGDSAWVKKNVLKPLEAFNKTNGDKLNIFFDEKSIGIGEAFTAKYMWAIVDSKVFIPVMSKAYYAKNHCKNEMDLAYKRKVEKLLEILPIAFSHDAVPEIFRGDNYLNIEKPNFIEILKAELLKALLKIEGLKEES